MYSLCERDARALEIYVIADADVAGEDYSLAHLESSSVVNRLVASLNRAH